VRGGFFLGCVRDAQPTFGKVFGMPTAMSLSTAELARLREWLAGIAHPGECIAPSSSRPRPADHVRIVVAHGPTAAARASGLQRFRCLGCRRSYDALTGTPLARLRKKAHWLTYLQCVLDSRTVRQAATVGKLPSKQDALSIHAIV